jgi:hypothetical protein
MLSLHSLAAVRRAERRWRAQAAWVALAFCALACRENAEAESKSTDVHAASAPLDIPTTDASTLLKNVSQTHARFQATLQDAENHGVPTLDLLLPKTWQHAKPSADSPMFPSAHGLFSDLDPQRPAVVAVEFSPAPHEVPIDALLRTKLQGEGWQIIKGNFYTGPFAEFYEATATRKVGKTLVVGRISARLHHGTIILVSAACPRERWDEVKSDLWLAHVAAELLGTKPDGKSEERKRVSSLPEARGRGKRPPLFETEYPASWSAEVAASTDKDISGIHFRLISGEVLEAYIVARAQRHGADAKPAISELIASAKRMVERPGARFKSEPQPLAAQDDPRAQSIPGWLGGFVADGQLGDADIDIRMGFAQSDKLTFGITMIGPKLNSDAIAALRSQRAFEIIRAGLASPEFSTR